VSVKVNLQIDEVRNGYIIEATKVGNESDGHYIADNKQKVKEIVLKLLDVYLNPKNG